MKLTRNALIGIVALTAAMAHADSFDLHVADVRLLQAKAIQKELGITEVQRAKMNAAAEASQKGMRAYGAELEKTHSQPDQAKLMGYLKQVKDGVLAQLSPGQLKRLREICLQRLGATALTDSEVATRVGCSSAQVTKLRDAYQKGRSQFMVVQQGFAEPILKPYKGQKIADRATAEKVDAQLKAASLKAAPKLKAIGDATEKSMLAVLTSAQQRTWSDLKGKAFKG